MEEKNTFDNDLMISKTTKKKCKTDIHNPGGLFSIKNMELGISAVFLLTRIQFVMGMKVSKLFMHKNTKIFMGSNLQLVKRKKI